MDTTKLNQFLNNPLTLSRLDVILVDIPQKETFTSAIGIRKSRRALIVKWIDNSGAIGYGECSCRPDPFYSHEFVEGAEQVIETFIFPLIAEVQSYQGLLEQLRKIKGWNFTKAAIESAANDAIRRRTGIGILEAAEIDQIDKVPVGISLGLFESASSMREKVEEISPLGYQRLKFKISNTYNDPTIINELGSIQHRNLSLDANGSFSTGSFKLLSHYAELDYFIEQPFPAGELYLMQDYLEHNKPFRICLDEEVESFGSLVSNHLQIDELNIKPGRVGGLWNTLKMINYCSIHGIKAWIGGMFETGIGRAQNLQLAAMLPEAKAHDLSPSNRYFEVDLITNPIAMDEGFIDKEYFTEIEVDQEILNSLTIRKKSLKV
jgi:O-succinylbenzoate synthase